MCTPSKLVIGTVVCAVAMVALVEANGAGDIWSLAGPNICGIAPDQRQKLGECIAEKLGVPPPPPIKACITDFAKKPKEECEKPEAVDSVSCTHTARLRLFKY